VAEREDQISSLSQTVTERDGQISSLTDETVRRGEWAMRLIAELEHERTQFHVLASSNSWFITKPLRETRRWFTAPKQQTKRYLKGSLGLAKKIYQSLPLSYQTKASHRNALANYFPRLLLVSGSHSATIPASALPAISQAMPVESLNHTDFVKNINLPTTDNPCVSIIIPIYGQVDYTLRCLSSIAENAPQVPFEVIVVDDFSPDNSVEILSEAKGIRLIRNVQNQGFIRSCNAGSSVAKGDYLYFLNNDTEVTTGWLDALLRTFHDFPGTGLVGSKLVYPDGRLQEAGGIIWQDASAWNFGKFQDPLLPLYNYAREVDYCSGASIMVPKALFDELGGFDEHYLPAYCEDADLALKIRDKGCRVIYQPMSTVIHYEGITSGTDTAHGTKAYQVENSQKLYERWKNRLQGHQPNGTADSKVKCNTRYSMNKCGMLWAHQE
jgi:GT2 family glycosyltransferase